jgi:hypothetical protein
MSEGDPAGQTPQSPLEVLADAGGFAGELSRARAKLHQPTRNPIQGMDVVPAFLQSLPDEVRVEYMDELAHRQIGEPTATPRQERLLPFGQENEWAEFEAAQSMARIELGREPSHAESLAVLERYKPQA